MNTLTHDVKRLRAACRRFVRTCQADPSVQFILRHIISLLVLYICAIVILMSGVIPS